MTSDEFISEFREQFNLAARMPIDVFAAFAESVGVKRLPGEMDSDFLDRLAKYLKSQYPRKAK